MGLPSQIVRAANRYQPVTIDGLTLYPVTVGDYEHFLVAKPAITFMAQSLPVRLMRLPLLQAFYRMDMEAILENREPELYFQRALLFLSLALRLAPGEGQKERLKQFQIFAEHDDPKTLKAVGFTDSKSGEIHKITPVQFARLRPVLALQNGIELYSDRANPELVEAENDIADQNAPKMNASLENLISGVAAFSGVDEADIDLWPILKLQRRAESYKRFMDYMVCGIGETQGTSWKSGNPHPSPWFDRIRTDSPAAMPISQFAGGAAEKAIAEQSK